LFIANGLTFLLQVIVNDCQHAYISKCQC